MTTITILDIPKSTFTKTKYNSLELLKILMQNIDYEVELGFFSENEYKNLVKSSNGKYDIISNLID